jgi:hypothetical protein
MGDRSRPPVVGQRSVREKEWLETLRIFGIGKEDGKRIINKLALGKDISVRASQVPQGG